VTLELEARESHPAAWRAPSWSWAAIDSKVEFPEGRLEQQYFTIDDAQSCPATSDRMGRVEGGSITITGRLFPATLSTNASSLDPNWTLSIDNTDYVFSDGFEYDRRNVIYLDYPFDPFGLGEKSVPLFQKLYCIRMARMHAKSHGWKHTMKDLYQLEETSTEDETEDETESGVEAENRKDEMVEGDEYALVVCCLNEQKREYKRLGMAVQMRKSFLSDNVVNPSRMWRRKPSVFEEGGFQETVTLV